MGSELAWVEVENIVLLGDEAPAAGRAVITWHREFRLRKERFKGRAV